MEPLNLTPKINLIVGWQLLSQTQRRRYRQALPLAPRRPITPQMTSGLMFHRSASCRHGAISRTPKGSHKEQRHE